jgi:hypothetical protein
MEFKAEQELLRAGYASELPTEQIERRTPGRKPVVRHVPLMRQYITATGKPHNAKYVKRPIGLVEISDVRRIQIVADKYSQRPAKIENPYNIGQPVLIGDVPGVVATTSGEDCVVAVTMLGKQHLRPLHYSRIRPG